MFYLGIDTAKATLKAILLDNEGEKRGNLFSFPHSTRGYQLLINKLNELKISRDNLLIGIEACGNFCENLYDFLKNKGFNVQALSPFQVSRYREMLNKKAKTDAIDALVIAGLLRTKDYSHIFLPEEKIAALRELVQQRFSFIKDLHDYKRQALSLLSLIFPEYQQTVLKNPFAVASLAIFQQYPTAKELAQAKSRHIEKIVRFIQGNNFNCQGINKLIKTAQESTFSGKAAKARGKVLSLLLHQIKQLQNAITELDQEIALLLAPEEPFDQTPGNNLHTIPGVGPKTIAAFLSAVGETGQSFTNAIKITGHIGYFPKIYQTGQTRRDNKISKRGPKYLRWHMYLSAVACIKHNPEFRTLYHKKVSQGKHKKQAIIYVAKKLTQMMLSMLKSGQSYNPARVFIPC